jgi:hypothetical protein
MLRHTENRGIDETKKQQAIPFCTSQHTLLSLFHEDDREEEGNRNEV